MPTGTQALTRALSALTVSILVLLDDAYRQSTRPFNCLDDMSFQSLFFWMMPTGGPVLIMEIRNLVVSILVLLDDAYRLRDKENRLMATTSFNPCSSG